MKYKTLKSSAGRAPWRSFTGFTPSLNFRRFFQIVYNLNKLEESYLESV